MGAAADLDDAAARVLRRISLWTPAGWTLADRAEQTFQLITALADLGADAAGRERRVVPRLADTVLPDQFAVMVADLARADPVVRAEAADLVAELAAALGL